MDHLIDQFDVYIDSSFSDFREEWALGKYKKYSECPSYGKLRTLLDSVNHLRKYIGWKSMTIKDMLECY